ncbi:MAG: hypothetical protein M3R10_07625 [Verrucomicrobiota bacterium]|nr:hypothetical protein [Verrucomicrobiota bacterium]
MKYFFLIAVIAVTIFAYFHESSADSKKVFVEQPRAIRPAATSILIASNVPYNDRWKTGPNAQTDLKVGPNAQTSFEPFAPSEHATWNQTPGYTIVAGRHTR